MINTVDNYISGLYDSKSYFLRFDKNGKKQKKDNKVIGEKLSITLNDYLNDKNNQIISFVNDLDKQSQKNQDELIISLIKTTDDTYSAKTGNYVGKFFWNGLEINIGSRFSPSFLKRMLNFANDVYVDDIDVFGVNSIGLDFSKLILYYLFVQALEKAFLLGLPRTYQSVQHHEMRLKGRLDIYRLIQKDIPFVGKISSVSRELIEVQEIVDVLHKAVKVVEREGSQLTKNLSHIKPHLRKMRSNAYVSYQTLAKAKSSKALLNPIFSPYKTVLRYAEYIIKLEALQKSEKESQTPYFGFLVNVAELFEIYVTKLLQKEFSDWSVSSPKIDLYNDPVMFYQRKIIPDIVMQKGNEVLVFDTKYKRMNYQGKNSKGMGDVDRNDFFQINTYMSYYQQQDFNLICGGLLYPLSAVQNPDECHAKQWFGNTKVNFIVDGIRVPDSDSDSDSDSDYNNELRQGENAFIDRIKDILSPS